MVHGLICSMACGSSRTSARTNVPCIGRRILNTAPPGTSLCFSFYFTLEYSFFFLFFCFLILFLAALGLHCSKRAFSNCGERGILFIAVCGLLIVVAFVAEHGL